MSTVGFIYETLLNDPMVCSEVGEQIYQGFAPAQAQGPVIVLTHVYSTDIYYVPTAPAIQKDTVQVALYEEDSASLVRLRLLAEDVSNALIGRHQVAYGNIYVYAGWRVGYVESITEENGKPYASIRMDFRFDYTTMEEE